MTADFRETLYTIDRRGERKWVYSAIVKGLWLKRRAAVAYVLIAIYLVLPWLSIAGQQAVLLDIQRRKFLFFGIEFWATDTIFLFLIFGILAFSLFFFTALFGRVWCGWACPETVFLEFLFRPIERLVEGGPLQRLRLDQEKWSFRKVRIKLVKHGICAFFAWIIATSFLAYFVGREPLIEMMTNWPHHNPVPFAVTLGVMALLAFQFGWFREQFCTLLCPYARFQSVLMDSESLVVGYDLSRGEPRGKLVRGVLAEGKGDCIDCDLCVRVCPTGIDIRNGMQLECVACTACIDACDSVMGKIGRPLGLIRYDTENRLQGATDRVAWVRTRTIFYGLVLVGFLVAFVVALYSRSLTDFQILRGAGNLPFIMLEDGRISNPLKVKIANKSNTVQRFTFYQKGIEGAELVIPLVPLEVPPGELISAPIFLNFFPKDLRRGQRKVIIVGENQSGSTVTQEITVLGPG